VIDSYGNDKSSWDNLTFSYGSADNIYYEDNTFTINNSPHMAGVGGRYCARFNTYTSSAGLYPFADMHGNMGVSGNYSTMGAEIYGNNIISTSGIRLLGPPLFQNFPLLRKKKKHKVSLLPSHEGWVFFVVCLFPPSPFSGREKNIPPSDKGERGPEQSPPPRVCY